MSYINNYRPQQGQGKYQGNPNQSSLKDLDLEQARINEDISKKLASHDKILENINNKIDNFSSVIKDQLSYNKMLETQTAQLSTAMLSATNLEKVNVVTTRGGKSTSDPTYPAKTGKAPAVQKEKEDNDVEEFEPQEREAQHDFHDTNFLPFPCKYRRPAVDE